MIENTAIADLIEQLMYIPDTIDCFQDKCPNDYHTRKQSRQPPLHRKIIPILYFTQPYIIRWKKEWRKRSPSAIGFIYNHCTYYYGNYGNYPKLLGLIKLWRVYGAVEVIGN